MTPHVNVLALQEKGSETREKERHFQSTLATSWFPSAPGFEVIDALFSPASGADLSAEAIGGRESARQHFGKFGIEKGRRKRKGATRNGVWPRLNSRSGLGSRLFTP